MSNAVSQMNVEYSPKEDRLILRILTKDSSEILLWLTRRYTKLLLGVFDKLTKSETNSPYEQEIKQFKHEHLVSEMDFQTEYKGGKGVSFPCGEVPILVTKISYKILQNKNIKLTLGQEISNGIDVNLVLDEKLKHALFEMLVNAASGAQWDFGRVLSEPKKSTNAVISRKGPVH